MEELQNILWAYKTTPRESMKMTPFHLVYEEEALVPIKIGIEFARIQAYDFDNPNKWLLELNFITKIQEKAAMRLSVYRQWMC